MVYKHKNLRCHINTLETVAQPIERQVKKVYFCEEHRYLLNIGETQSREWPSRDKSQFKHKHTNLAG